MSAASFLNEIGKAKAKSGYQNFDSLEQGKPYKINSFSAHKSNAFDKERIHVRAHIEEGYLILPERYDDCYKQLKTLNTDNLYIIYNGRSGKGNRIEIEFEERDADAALDDGDGNGSGDDTNNKNKNGNKNNKNKNGNKK